MTTMPPTTSPLPSSSASPRRMSGPSCDARRRRGPGSACRCRSCPTAICSMSVDRADVAAAAHHVLGAGELDEPPADVVVRCAGSRRSPAERHVVGEQRRRVESPGTASRSRRRTPPRPRPARSAASSAGTSPGTSAAPRGVLPLWSTSAYSNTQPTPVASGPRRGLTPSGSAPPIPCMYSSTRLRAQ